MLSCIKLCSTYYGMLYMPYTLWFTVHAQLLNNTLACIVLYWSAQCVLLAMFCRISSKLKVADNLIRWFMFDQVWSTLGCHWLSRA